MRSKVISVRTTIPSPFPTNIPPPETPPLTFTLIAAFITIEEFTESCRKVYFATEDYSLATFILVNAGLTYLFMEKAMTATDTKSAELLRHHYTCRDNLETALSNLPLLMPARIETIKALILGASYAVEIAKLTLAWHLNTSAALMCQALGYHRLPVNFSPSDSPSPSSASASSSTAPNPPSSSSSSSDASLNDTKSGLFWFTYMLDKGLSLRFGRSSVIQDYDITLPKAISPQMNLSDPWKVVLNLWILQAELTGKVYEHLYSPTALAKPLEVRVVAARTLAEEIKVLARESDTLYRRVKENQNQGQAQGTTSGNGKAKPPGSAPVGFYTMDVVLKSDEVWYWSSLALVYRTIPASGDGVNGNGNGNSLNMECIEAARNAINTHHESMKLTEGSRFTQAAYLHW